jgi:hypothetical protein
MSLRDAYFNGPTGIQQQMDGAFQAGIAYVGAGVSDVSTLDLNDRNGSNLGAGSGMPGKYFLYASPTTIYAPWILVSGEVAPTVSATLVQVTVLSGDSSTQVAAKIATAMNAIAGEPFSVVSNADVVTMTNTIAGAAVVPVNLGTIGGTAAVNQVRAGVSPTGNFSTLQGALTAAAAQGLTDFRVLVQGTGTANATYLRFRNGNNQYLSAFFAGISYALAGQNIYDYQCGLTLDISMSSSTNVMFSFHFGSHMKKESVNLEPLTSCGAFGNVSNGGVLPI